MKKISAILFVLLFHVSHAQELDIKDFNVDIYSTQTKSFSKKIDLSLKIIGRDVQKYSYKIIDAINIIIGSYSVENLMTSQGKEAFKKALIKYVSKTYSLDIDHIYIEKMYILTSPKLNDFINAMKENGCCNANPISSEGETIINFE